MTKELIEYAAAIFTAGGLAYMIRRWRKDLNGVGKLLRDTVKREAELRLQDKKHANNVNVAIMAMVPEEKKKEIAALLREEE